MRILSFHDLRDVGINWSRQHVYRKVKAGEFPKPVHLGEATVGWIEAELNEWLKARAAERDGAA